MDQGFRGLAGSLGLAETLDFLVTLGFRDTRGTVVLQVLVGTRGIVDRQPNNPVTADILVHQDTQDIQRPLPEHQDFLGIRGLFLVPQVIRDSAVYLVILATAGVVVADTLVIVVFQGSVDVLDTLDSLVSVDALGILDSLDTRVSPVVQGTRGSADFQVEAVIQGLVE